MRKKKKEHIKLNASYQRRLKESWGLLYYNCAVNRFKSEYELAVRLDLAYFLADLDMAPSQVALSNPQDHLLADSRNFVGVSRKNAEQKH